MDGELLRTSSDKVMVNNDKSMVLDSFSDAVFSFSYMAGGYNFLVATACYCEVVSYPDIFPIPSTPKMFSGLMSVRGDFVPVYDFDVAFNRSFPDNNNTKNYVIVFNRGANAVGILINKIPEHFTIDVAERVEQLPELPPALAANITSVYKANGKTWLQLDHECYFSDLLRSW